MKKGLLMLGVAALALASCTNEEVLNVSDSRAIGFTGTGIDNITKADITSTDFAKFYVYGGYTGEEKEAVFNKIEVTKSGKKWSYSPTQYWIAGTWNFAGYAAGTCTEGEGNGVTPDWNNKDGKLSLTINSSADNQDDVIFAKSQNIEVSDPATYTDAVSLNFTHLLSKIQFKFIKDKASLNGVTVKLKDFKVAQLITEAKWVDGDQEAAQGTPTKGDYTDFAEYQEIANDGELPTEEFYVIPQDVEEFAITVNAEVTDVNGTKIKDGEITATVPTTTVTDWEAQKKYVYTATLKYENIVPEPGETDPKPIEFTGEAKDWEDGDATEGITPGTTTQP